MRVVDTNILFPLLVRSSFTDKVTALHRLDPDWCTEVFALTELANILATYERSGLLSPTEALGCLDRAENWLVARSHSVPPSAALEIAIRHRVTAYDARFLLLAQNLGTRLVSEDTKLRAAAPGLTQSLDEALANPG